MMVCPTNISGGKRVYVAGITVDSLCIVRVSQLLYVLFLGTLSIAVLWPSCGNTALDAVCVSWIFLIGLETADRTYRLHRVS